MLTEILNRLAEGRAYSTPELALLLGVSSEVVAAELDYLKRIGAIHTVGGHTGCGSCSSCGGGCHEVSGPTMWEKV